MPYPPVKTTDLNGAPRLVDHDGLGPPDVNMGASEAVDLALICAPCDIVDSVPPSCAADARYPHDPADALQLFNWDSIALTMSCDASTLRPAAFAVIVEPRVAEPPSIVGLDPDGNTVEVIFSRPIDAGHWTCVLHVQSGTMACLGSLPADVANDGVANAADELELLDHLNRVLDDPLADYQCDIDRSGECNAADALGLIDLLNGAGQFESWNGARLPECPATPCESEIVLTQGVDVLFGTSANDLFCAPLVFDTVTREFVPTLENGDTVDGQAGTDVLDVDFNFDQPTTVTPLILANIETLTLSDSGTAPTILDVENLFTVARIESVRSTNPNPLVVDNIPVVTDAGLVNTDSGLTLSYSNAATAGDGNTMTLELADTQSGIVTIDTDPLNGIETFIINSAGFAENRLKDVRINNDSDSTTAQVDLIGDQALLVDDAFGNNVPVIDATGSTGGVNVSVGDTETTVAGGSGDDTIRFAGAHFNPDDTVDGSSGDDTLSLLSADAVNATSPLTNVSNFERLTIADTLAGDLDVTHYGTSVLTVNLEDGISCCQTVTVSRSSFVTFGVEEQGIANTGDNTIALKVEFGDDACELVYNDCDSTGATNVLGFSFVSLVSNGNLSGTEASNGANTFAGRFGLTGVDAPTVLQVSGDEDVAFQAGIGGTDTINAAGSSANLLMALNASGSTVTSTTPTFGTGVVIFGGTGNDVLVGSIASDSIFDGEGNDTVQPGRGIDFVTLGPGSDILDLEDLDPTSLVAANRCRVRSGFTADGTAYTGATAVDAIRFDDVGVGDLSDGASPGEFQSEAAPAAEIVYGPGVAILEMAWEFSLLADVDEEAGGEEVVGACGADIGTTPCTITMANDGDTALLILYQDGFAYIYRIAEGPDPDSIVDVNSNPQESDMQLIAILTGAVSSGGFDASQFID